MEQDTADRRSSPARNQAIEILRIAAAYGIVAYHSGAPLQDWTYAGLVVFLILSPYVDCAFNWGRPRPLGALVKTFVIPWLFWLAFYGALNIALSKPLFPVDNVIAGLLYGTSAHLWFMPAMFTVLVLLNQLKTRMSPIALFWASAIIAALLLATVTLWRSVSTGWMPPLPQWIHAAPMIALGVALGLGNKVPRSIAIPVAALLVLCMIPAMTVFLPGVSITYAVGIAAVLAAAWLGPLYFPVGWNVQSVAGCMLGVYLSHIFWLMLFNRITGQANYYTATLAFLFAFGAVWLAQRLLPFSRLVIGSPVRAG